MLNKDGGYVQKWGIVKAGEKEAEGAAVSSELSPKTDRRILRTRDSLGDALVALIQEKNLERRFIFAHDSLAARLSGLKSFFDEKLFTLFLGVVFTRSQRLTTVISGSLTRAKRNKSRIDPGRPK
jgi:hypothetical protein